MIGWLTAYYDREMARENNPFCAIGLNNHLTYKYGGNSYQLDHGVDYKIDPVSLAVTLIQF